MGTIFDREHEPPGDEPEDTAFAAVQAVVGVVPGAAALLERVITPPLVRRQREWMEDIAAAVRRLENTRHISPEDLRDDPAFIDAVLSATQAAIKTSQQEKRDALRNAVLNAALPSAPDVATQQMFIAFVDRFTDWHLRLLKLFHDPNAYRHSVGLSPIRVEDVIAGSLTQVIDGTFLELRNRREFYDQVWSDLNGAGLVNTPRLQGMMTGGGMLQKRTTELGDQFLRFIESPLQT